MKRELPIPPDTANAEDSIEMLRVWLINNRLEFSFDNTHYSDIDPGIWGMILADVCTFISKAISESSEEQSTEAIELIKNSFLSEMPL